MGPNKKIFFKHTKKQKLCVYELYFCCVVVVINIIENTALQWRHNRIRLGLAVDIKSTVVDVKYSWNVGNIRKPINNQVIVLK